MHLSRGVFFFVEISLMSKKSQFLGRFGSVGGILTLVDAIKLMTAKLTSNLRLYVLEDTTCDIMSTAQGRSKQKGKKDNGGIGN
jgi:hypothetical protein